MKTKIGTPMGAGVCHEKPMMKTYTVIAYVLPDGAHYVEKARAKDGTAAAVKLRKRLGLKLAEFEVVAIAEGELAFAPVDEKQLALAPFSPASLQ